jgi:hypothetical protein
MFAKNCAKAIAFEVTAGLPVSFFIHVAQLWPLRPSCTLFSQMFVAFALDISVEVTLAYSN